MYLIEKKMDLFDCHCDAYAHCISLDCAMGAGIAKEFVKRYPNMKKKLLEDNFNFKVGQSILYNSDFKIFNLVTKERYWYKPSYRTIRKSIEYMKNEICLINKNEQLRIKTIAMPKIGCGLDRLNWDKVKFIIEDVFSDTDINIIICYL